MKVRMTAEDIPILLEWLLRRGRDEFREETKNYGKGFDLELLDACELLELYGEVKRRLQERGLQAPAGPPSEELPDPPPEEIFVNRDYRIFLPKRNGQELKLRPLVKTVFLLFLRHPEGILLKSVGEYRAEMESLYSKVSCRSDQETVSATVARLADALDNSIHENCSRLNARLSEYFQGTSLENLQVKGEYGGLRRIRHDRMLVRWESDGRQ